MRTAGPRTGPPDGDAGQASRPGLGPAADDRRRSGYAVAPFHPPAEIATPLTARQMGAYRGVVAADSARRLPGRSLRVQPNQDTLIVPTLAAKLDAQGRGLGVGFLPEALAGPETLAGRWAIKTLATPREDQAVRVAWRGVAHRRIRSRLRMVPQPTVRPRAGW